LPRSTFRVARRRARAWRACALAAALCALAACDRDEDATAARGRGLHPAPLPASTRAEIYAAAMGASFDLGPPLTLLLDSRMLTRRAGYAPGAQLPAPVLRAALRTDAFQGLCRPTPPPRDGLSPTCHADQPGYVVRVSDILRATGDTLELYAMAQRYDTDRSGAHHEFILEEAYQLVHRDGRWIVARKGRVTS